MRSRYIRIYLRDLGVRFQNCLDSLSKRKVVHVHEINNPMFSIYHVYSKHETTVSKVRFVWDIMIIVTLRHVLKPDLKCQTYHDVIHSNNLVSNEWHLTLL